MKRSKCEFGQTSIAYLGHIITKEGITADPEKIQAMITWPRPKSVKLLREFLGLTGYYRKFIQDYGKIARPLTELLRKNSFGWNNAAEEAFKILKLKLS